MTRRPAASAFATAREFPLRAVAVITLVLVAYNYSLLTLARGLSLQTPLAYLGLVPLIAVGLAIARSRVEPPQLPIHDRQLDWIVGALLLAAAAALIIALPISMPNGFWLQRLDLLTLPLFVAGVITILYGIRRTWSLRFPIAFLLLAWPTPYMAFLTGATQWFTDVTATAVNLATGAIPIARASASDPTLFVVGSGDAAFSVSIGSACAGMNGFVGFLILGTALLYLVRGPLLRRAAWLAIGLALVFGLNVVRILAILGVGAYYGQDAAIDVLHPFAGLVVFAIGVVLMVAVVPRFGLRFMRMQPHKSEDPRGDDPNPVRRIRAGLLVAAAVAVVLAVTNVGFVRFEAISTGLGEARMPAFNARSAVINDWNARHISAFPMARQYFGDSATWDRVLWWADSSAPLYSSRSLYVDVITTDDPSTLSAYGVEECYRFHGYEIASIADADIGSGVQAQLITYANDEVNAYWSAMWWEWPYEHDGFTRYARVVVMLSEGQETDFRGMTAEAIATQAAQFVDSDRFLVTLGRQIVANQVARVARS